MNSWLLWNFDEFFQLNKYQKKLIPSTFTVLQSKLERASEKDDDDNIHTIMGLTKRENHRGSSFDSKRLLCFSFEMQMTRRSLACLLDAG